MTSGNLTDMGVVRTSITRRLLIVGVADFFASTRVLLISGLRMFISAVLVNGCLIL